MDCAKAPGAMLRHESEMIVASMINGLSVTDCFVLAHDLGLADDGVFDTDWGRPFFRPATMYPAPSLLKTLYTRVL